MSHPSTRPLVHLILATCLTSSALLAQKVQPLSINGDDDITAAAIGVSEPAAAKAPAPKSPPTAIPAPPTPTPATAPAPTSTPVTVSANAPKTAVQVNATSHDDAEPVKPTSSGLLPRSSQENWLPAGKSFAKTPSTFIWNQAPIAQALDEVARASGLNIQIILPAGVAPTVTGDFSALAPSAMVRAIAYQNKLVVTESNGSYQVTVPMQPSRHEAQPVINSREFIVARDSQQMFAEAFTQSKKQGTLTLLGSDSHGTATYRVQDTPEGLDAITDTYRQFKAKALSATPSAKKEDTKIAKERSRLVEQRRKLAESIQP